MLPNQNSTERRTATQYCTQSEQEMRANAHEIHDSISLILYAGCCVSAVAAPASVARSTQNTGALFYLPNIMFQNLHGCHLHNLLSSFTEHAT